MQEINLDWILTKVKNILRFVPDDGSVGQILRRTAHGAEWSNEQGGGGAVNSVNGQTGDVVLDASDVGALPDTTVIPTDTSDLTNNAGFVDAAGAAAAAPVQKVNGQTGTVTINKTSVGLGNVANVLQYSASNPPPYPVTSVNGQTGDVVVPTGSPLDCYPVGSIYMSVSSTNPASLFGGTWQQLENRFLLGAGSNYAAGTTGGEATHTLTINEMPSHSHVYHGYNSIVQGGGATQQVKARVNYPDDPADYGGDAAGGGQAHNNMPPYLTVYMWKRTA